MISSERCDCNLKGYREFMISRASSAIYVAAINLVYSTRTARDIIIIITRLRETIDTGQIESACAL